MGSPERTLQVFLELGRISDERGQFPVRDRFLVIAAAAAGTLGHWELARSCRRKVLDHNAGHIIGRYESVSDALADEEFQEYLRALERRYPLERMEFLLQRWQAADSDASS